MSQLLELVGIALLTVAANTLFGTGVAEAVAGVSLIVVAQGVDGVKPLVWLKDRWRSVRARVRRAPKTPPQ